MNKILVPYDFSDVAKHALNFAADLARKTDTHTVSLIHVIEHPTPDTIKTMGFTGFDPMENLYLKKLIETVDARMKDLMADATYKDITLKYKVVLGQPFNQIAEEISTEGVELVVMGTTGATGAQELLVGSNAERMVRYAKCPVITVRDAASASQVQDIVLASQFQDVPLAFIENIKKIQKLFDAELHLVRVNTPSTFNSTRHDRKLMQDFITQYDLHNCDYSTYNHPNEEDGIIAFAQDIDADLIALGTRQRRGLSHFLSGSIAEDVVNHAKVPVWTFGFDN